MTRRLAPLVVALLLVPNVFIAGRYLAVAQDTGAKSKVHDETIRLLADQAEAWNRGDLDGFMAGYWKDDRLTFFSGGDITRGWQKTYDRYRKRYQSEGREMGRLEFREVQIESLGTDAAFARGRWQLTMKDASTPNGLYTLFFRRIDGRWRIVHDHTSMAENK